MKNLVAARDAVDDIPDGATIMIGGFMCCGMPLGLCEALLAKGSKDLTVICNDAGLPGQGIAKLITAGRVRKLIASHIGLNPEAGQKMNSQQMEVLLVPQGTLAERIRCHGAGLGGFLTPTGTGTDVEKGKEKFVVEGREFILEKPLGAEFALVAADVCDRFGNAFIGKARKTFNIVMAMAAKRTILESRRVVNIGDLNPDEVNLPGVFVNRIAEG